MNDNPRPATEAEPNERAEPLRLELDPSGGCVLHKNGVELRLTTLDMAHLGIKLISLGSVTVKLTAAQNLIGLIKKQLS